MWFDFEVWQQEQAMGRAILSGRSLSLNFANKCTIYMLGDFPQAGVDTGRPVEAR
jgi:hypothetical protein